MNRNKGFLIALLEDFSLDKVDIISNNDKLMEGIKSAFGSPGGKFFVAGKLIGLFPEHKRYVEPFIGGGSVLFRKNKGEQEFINDKDEEIYFLFKFMQDITEQQLEALNKMDWKTTEVTFNKLVKEYKESPSHKDPVYRFYRAVYLKQTSDAGEMRSFDNRAEEAGEVLKVTSRLMKIKERLAGVTIENMDYKDFVKKYSNAESLTFLDPPYPSARMNWKWCPTQEEFESFTKTIPGRWMITYEVCDGWKESKYHRKILSQYNIAAPTAKKGHMSRKSEMVITNFPMKENTSFLSEAMIEEDFWKNAANFFSVVDLSTLYIESNNLEEELKEILKLYANKRRGEDVKETFEQLKQSFRKKIKKCIENGITNFQPEKLSPFALELFNKYTEYKYIVVQPDGNSQAFSTLKELKDSGVDYRAYKFDIKVKEAEKQYGDFAYYNQYWKSKTTPKTESFIITTNLGIDIICDRDVLSDKFKGSVFYLKPSKYDAYRISESTIFAAPNSNFNITTLPSWIKNIDSGKVSILESTELEKVIEFSGDKLNGIYVANRDNENADFWTLKKSS